LPAGAGLLVAVTRSSSSSSPPLPVAARFARPRDRPERTAAERKALVDALFAPLSDADVGSMARQAAARTILERLLGKPTGQIAQEDQPEELPLETLVEMWREMKRQRAEDDEAQQP
jgi:ABC-type branched-subunit amino acid transport system substrate-binding protein